MTTDLTGSEFTLGPFNYRALKFHFSGIQLFEITSAYNNPNDPGVGYSVTEKPHLHWEYPRDSMRNHAFSRNQLAQAERLFDLLVATPPAFRQGVGRGFVEDMRRPLQKLPNPFVR
jgi:hypothetical protein